MPFNESIPQPNDLLSDSQGDLLNNNGFLNASFGVDHYAFNDATSNNGKHQVIQMPVQSAIPVTTTDPVAFSFQQASGNQGILQYLCGPSGVVASPILPLQSSASGITLPPNTPETIFDFTNSLYCFGEIIGSGLIATTPLSTPTVCYGVFFYSGSHGVVTTLTDPNSIAFQFSGNLLQAITPMAFANVSQFAWTLSFKRIFTPT